MKNLTKRLSFTLIFVLILGLSIGCNNDGPPKEESKIYTSVGFIENTLTENEKNYVEIGFNEKSLKLEVKDEDVFNDLKEDDFYKFAFDENNTLLSIEDDVFLEDLVRNSMKDDQEPEDEDPISETRISSEDKLSTDDLTLLESFEFDINNDGSEEKIAMYANVEQGPDGEIYWDDGQDWLFLVEGQEEDYVLFNDYIQIGNLSFHVFTIDDDFYITTIQSTTANLQVNQYKFDPESNEFISTSEYQTSGNVNMIYSTSLY